MAGNGGTPLVVCINRKVVGVIELQDIIKPGIEERFERLRKMGVKTVMVTGDNPSTARYIAEKAGVDDFIVWLKKYVYGAGGQLEDGIYVQNVRHEYLLKQALSALSDAIAAAGNHVPYDCIIIDLRNAVEAIGFITGDTVSDEIINEIFARFCVGK